MQSTLCLVCVQVSPNTPLFSPLASESAIDIMEKRTFIDWFVFGRLEDLNGSNVQQQEDNVLLVDLTVDEESNQHVNSTVEMDEEMRSNNGEGSSSTAPSSCQLSDSSSSDGHDEVTDEDTVEYYKGMASPHGSENRLTIDLDVNEECNQEEMKNNSGERTWDTDRLAKVSNIKKTSHKEKNPQMGPHVMTKTHLKGHQTKVKPNLRKNEKASIRSKSSPSHIWRRSNPTK